jgi:predicted O-methyltransferase YrrM
MKAYSYAAAPTFKGPIDFLFIDADHTYDAIKKDWADWFPKVNDGGIIALHDCRIAANSSERLGSMKFYEEDIPSVPEIREVEAVDCLSVFEVDRRSSQRPAK